jgi:hypothetical protein
LVDAIVDGKDPDGGLAGWCANLVHRTHTIRLTSRTGTPPAVSET